MTKEEHTELVELQKLVNEQNAQLKSISEKVKSLEQFQIMNEPPIWAADAVKAAVKSRLIDTPSGGSYDFYRLLTVLARKGVI